MSLSKLAAIVLIAVIAISSTGAEVVQEGLLAILKAVGFLFLVIPVLGGFLNSHKGDKKSKWY